MKRRARDCEAGTQDSHSVQVATAWPSAPLQTTAPAPDLYSTVRSGNMSRDTSDHGRICRKQRITLASHAHNAVSRSISPLLAAATATFGAAGLPQPV